MMKIKLSNSSKVALVSDKDFERVSKLRWFLHRGGYVFYTHGKVHMVMHRFICGEAPEGFLWDHINRNPLDNRRENLRLATPLQSSRNCRRRKDNKSGFIGVCLYKRGTCERWLAYLRLQGKLKMVGYFKNKIDAAKARDRAVKEHFGEFAVMNFPS